MWSILLSIVLVIDFLDSAGLLGLCRAMLDSTTFKVILTLTFFCAVGFLLTTVWSVAESLVYRRHKGSKWFRDVLSVYWTRTMELLPFRVAIKLRILSLVISVQCGIANIISRLKEWAQQFLYPDGNRRTVLPTALNANWENAITWALSSKSEELEAVHHDDRRDVNHDTTVIRAEEKEDATHFWKRPPIAEGLPLIVTKTQAHVRAIQ